MKNITKQRIQAVIEYHDKMQGCYFWNPPGSAHGRRKYEEANTHVLKFTHDKEKYEIRQTVKCSCKNIYYKMLVVCNGEETGHGLRFLKKLIK